MNVRIGDYVVRSDNMQYWIEKVTGKSPVKVAGYSPDIESLCKSFCKHKYRSSGAEDVRAFLSDMKETEAQCMDMIHNLLSGDSENPEMVSGEWGEEEL